MGVLPPNAKISDGSQPPEKLDLSLSESAGSRFAAPSGSPSTSIATSCARLWRKRQGCPRVGPLSRVPE